jgi:hypothetical protein
VASSAIIQIFFFLRSTIRSSVSVDVTGLLAFLRSVPCHVLNKIFCHDHLRIIKILQNKYSFCSTKLVLF